MHTIYFAQKNLEAARQFQAPDSLHGHRFALHASSAALETQALYALLQTALAPFDYSFLNAQLGAAVDDLALAARFAHIVQDHAQQAFSGGQDISPSFCPSPEKQKAFSGGQDISPSFCPSPEKQKLFSGGQNHHVSQSQHLDWSDLTIKLFSTQNSGVIWQQNHASRIIMGEFSAAHQLPHVPQGHQCGRLHGHSFGLSLKARADHYSTQEMQAIWQHIFSQLNHQYLNQIKGLDNPTSENLARWIWQNLAQSGQKIDSVTVLETKTSGSLFDGERFRIWKTQNFEAARPFDAQGRYTGDSYQLALHLDGDLDEIMGWIEDFGDVKANFAPLYQKLDHHALDTLPELCAFDQGAIARWILQQAQPILPNLCRVDVATGTLGASARRSA